MVYGIRRVRKREKGHGRRESDGGQCTRARLTGEPVIDSEVTSFSQSFSFITPTLSFSLSFFSFLSFCCGVDVKAIIWPASCLASSSTLLWGNSPSFISYSKIMTMWVIFHFDFEKPKVKVAKSRNGAPRKVSRRPGPEVKVINIQIRNVIITKWGIKWSRRIATQWVKSRSWKISDWACESQNAIKRPKTSTKHSELWLDNPLRAQNRGSQGRRRKSKGNHCNQTKARDLGNLENLEWPNETRSKSLSSILEH